MVPSRAHVITRSLSSASELDVLFIYLHLRLSDDYLNDDHRGALLHFWSTQTQRLSLHTPASRPEILRQRISSLTVAGAVFGSED